MTARKDEWKNWLGFDAVNVLGPAASTSSERTRIPRLSPPGGWTPTKHSPGRIHAARPGSLLGETWRRKAEQERTRLLAAV